MAKSPAHKFGQIIGNLIEFTTIEYLRPLAEKHGLYFDFKHERKARGGNREVIWKDINGNKHKLDIVLEEGGTEDIIGNPKAFIEIAWRRYTKHSKNKAQEIAGAIVPLIANYKKFSPFYGAVIAGDFTGPSIMQMKSEGFKIVYFEMDSIVKAFKKVNIDAYWGEDTPMDDIELKIKQYEALTNKQIAIIIDELIKLNLSELQEFVSSLEKAILRKIEKVRVLPLHGLMTDLYSIKEAYDYILDYNEKNGNAPLVKYEIIITYTNGDRFDVQFSEKQHALTFLKDFI